MIFKLFLISDFYHSTNIFIYLSVLLLNSYIFNVLGIKDRLYLKLMTIRLEMTIEILNFVQIIVLTSEMIFLNSY
jgi:hypothetical protein